MAAGLSKIERRIGDAVYTVHQLPFEDARPILWLGASVVLPALEALEGVDVLSLVGLGDTGKTILDVEVGVDAIGRGFRIFFDRATEADFARVEELFARHTFVQVDASPKQMRLSEIRTLHWPGRYPAFLSWLRFSIEVHFGPFSRGPAAGAVGRPLEATAQ